MRKCQRSIGNRSSSCSKKMTNVEKTENMAKLSAVELIDLAAEILEDIKLRLMEAAGEIEEHPASTKGGK